MLGLPGCAERSGAGRGGMRGRPQGARRCTGCRRQRRRAQTDRHIALATCRLASCGRGRDGRREPPSLGRRKGTEQTSGLQVMPLLHHFTLGRMEQDGIQRNPACGAAHIWPHPLSCWLLRNHFQPYPAPPVRFCYKIPSLQYEMFHISRSGTCSRSKGHGRASTSTGHCLCPRELAAEGQDTEAWMWALRFKFPIGFMGLLSGEIPIPCKLLGFCLRLLRPQHRIKHKIKYLHVLSNQEAIKKHI